MPNTIYGVGCTKFNAPPQKKKEKPKEIRINANEYCKAFGY